MDAPAWSDAADGTLARGGGTRPVKIETVVCQVGLRGMSIAPEPGSSVGIAARIPPDLSIIVETVQFPARRRPRGPADQTRE